MSKEYAEISEMTVFSYLQNKCVGTLSPNLQICSICIIQADSKLLEIELQLKITELKSKVLHVVLR